MTQFKAGIIYLAAPYSDSDPDVRSARCEAATKAAARLAAEGHIVFSPLTMTHPLDVILSEGGDSLGSDYWVSYDEAFMAVCSEIRVLRLPGWEKSSGVRRELAFFKQRGLPVSFIDPDAHEAPGRARVRHALKKKPIPTKPSGRAA